MLLVVLLVLLIPCYYLWTLVFFSRQRYRQYPGPASHHPFFGSLGYFLGDNNPSHVLRAWVSKYGGIFIYAGLFGVPRLVITDERALRHILVENSYAYPKSARTRRELALFIGEGLLGAEGETHKKQKRLLAPAFTQPRILGYSHIFLERSRALAQSWRNDLAGGRKEVDVSRSWSQLTFDIIGEAGFGTQFHAIEGSDEGFLDGVTSLLQGKPFQANLPRILTMLTLASFPGLLPYIPNERVQRALGAREKLRKRFEQIYLNKKEHAEEGGAKDLLSILIRANKATDAKSRLSDIEIQDQAITFLIAGHETVAITLSWASWVLAQHPDVQDALRKEIKTIQEAAKAEGRQVAMEEVVTAPYLAAVTKEVLRIHPPLGATTREASRADNIPLGKSIRLKNGTYIDHIPVKAGDEITIPLCAINTADGFGQDAASFDPSRWLSPLPDKIVTETRGVWPFAHIGTFLGGPRQCIGHRFSVHEIMATLFVMIGQFKFSSGTVPIVGRHDIVLRPYVGGQFDRSRLPLFVEPV